VRARLKPAGPVVYAHQFDPEQHPWPQGVSQGRRGFIVRSRGRSIPLAPGDYICTPVGIGAVVVVPPDAFTETLEAWPAEETIALRDFVEECRAVGETLDERAEGERGS
jgi:hypothetical protein